MNFKDMIDHLLDYFEDDEEKVAMWLTARNPRLGNLRPLEMILLGRKSKLYEFIANAKRENEPPDEYIS